MRLGNAGFSMRSILSFYFPVHTSAKAKKEEVGFYEKQGFRNKKESQFSFFTRPNRSADAPR